MKKFTDVPFMDEFTTSPIEKYKESIFVGYRYYNTIGYPVNYPFGYGLSYSKFTYSELKVENIYDNLKVSLKVKNTGNIESKDVIEIYASIYNANIVRPKKVLVGFTKVNLLPNEEKEVEIFIKIDNLKVYDVNTNTFVLEQGMYNISVSKNVNDDILTKDIFLYGVEIENKYSKDINDIYLDPIKLTEITDSIFEQLIGYKIPTHEFNKRPYTMETPIGEFNTFFGKIFKKIAVDIGLKQYKKACKEKDSPDKERRKKGGYFIYKMMPNNCLRSMCYSSGGMLKYKYAKCILELSNGHFFKGIKELLKKNK